jgi:hypothetical protein
MWGGGYVYQENFFLIILVKKQEVLLGEYINAS